jgi:pyruvate/2-oxoglutarate dehydrogenase complex dihydrolipoamide acyltransferase (E2) component
VTEKQTEALERLNQGIKESRQEVQQRTMNLAQEYFGDSAEVLKQQISENRATLENLPDQIPGGREDAFQALFQELMENYSAMEESINEAQQNVANLDTDQIRRQGEVEATDAARRQAKELGIDLTKVEGTGTDGRIIVSDVVEAAEAMGDGAGEEGSEVSGDGAAGEAAQGAQDAAGQVVRQVQDAAGGATQQAQDTAGQAVGQAQQAAGQVGQVAGQAQDTVGGLTGGGQQQQGGVGGLVGGVTDQVGQVAGQAQDTAGQVTDQAGQVAGQAQDAAGGAAQQAQDTVGQAAQQGQQAAGQAAQQGQQAAGQVAQQAGGGQQQGGQEPNATQAAQQKAQELGVDLSQVQGSGAGGRVTVRDVQQAANQ